MYQVIEAYIFQMKEREQEYKKSIEQLAKDKEEMSHQMKLMQEGKF